MVGLQSGKSRAEVVRGSRSSSRKCSCWGSRGGVSGGVVRAVGAAAVGVVVVGFCVWVMALEVGIGEVGLLGEDGLFMHGKTMGGGANALLSSFDMNDDAWAAEDLFVHSGFICCGSQRKVKSDRRACKATSEAPGAGIRGGRAAYRLPISDNSYQSRNSVNRSGQCPSLLLINAVVISVS